MTKCEHKRTWSGPDHFIAARYAEKFGGDFFAGREPTPLFAQLEVCADCGQFKGQVSTKLSHNKHINAPPPRSVVEWVPLHGQDLARRGRR